MPHVVFRRRLTGAIVATLLLVAGCLQALSPERRVGPGLPSPVKVEAWTYQGEPARRVVTPHYVIYATVTNDDFLESIGQLMEGALAEYRRLAPQVPETDRPMECYLFANRMQWAQFTKEKTGEDAAIYLKINRGGYTVRDWYVAYYLGDLGTFCVAAHEGFHQFASRHFRSRIPPFLEEGIACMFEDVSWDGRLPRWNLNVNNGRLIALRKAADAGLLLPLGDLAAMHAGQIISKSPEQIGGFYAQCWTFARFMYEYDGSRYRPALQKILSDAAEGTLVPSGLPRPGRAMFWNPKSAKPLLEHYLEADLETIDKQYQGYLADLVHDSRRGDRNDGG